MLLPVLKEGGPFLTLAITLFALVVVWALTKEIKRLHEVNQLLADRLVQA